MGVELHITRAEHWAENDDLQITAEEWLAYVDSDAELRLWPENGQHFTTWLGPSKHAEPWLDWSRGNVSTKLPDTALYCKMLRIAQALSAHVQDDDGTKYLTEADWQYDPTERIKKYERQNRPRWWQRWLGR